MTLSPILMQPGEQPELVLAFGAALASAVASVTAAGRVEEVAPLQVGSQSVADDRVTLRLSGGTLGEVYSVAVLATAVDGRQVRQVRQVLLVDLSFPMAEGAGRYLSIAEFVARAGIDTAVRLTDSVGAGQIHAPRLVEALNDAAGIIDAHLAARHRVPLAPPVPDPIPTYCYDLALARLWDGKGPEGVAKREDAALRALRDLAAGKVVLAAEVAPTDAPLAPVRFRPGRPKIFGGAL